MNVPLHIPRPQHFWCRLGWPRGVMVILNDRHVPRHDPVSASMTPASAADLFRDHRHKFVVGPHEAGFECDALWFRLGQADGDRQRLGRREGEVTEPQPNIVLGRRLNVPARDRLPIRPAAGEQMGHFLLR